MSVCRQSERVRDLWLDDSAGPNQADGNNSANDLAVFDDANLPQVSLKLATRNASGFAAVSTEVLGLATLTQFVSATRLEVSVEFQLFRSLNSLVFLECAHRVSSFMSVFGWDKPRCSKKRDPFVSWKRGTIDGFPFGFN